MDTDGAGSGGEREGAGAWKRRAPSCSTLQKDCRSKWSTIRVGSLQPHIAIAYRIGRGIRIQVQASANNATADQERQRCPVDADIACHGRQIDGRSANYFGV